MSLKIKAEKREVKKNKAKSHKVSGSSVKKLAKLIENKVKSFKF